MTSSSDENGPQVGWLGAGLDEATQTRPNVVNEQMRYLQPMRRATQRLVCAIELSQRCLG